MKKKHFFGTNQRKNIFTRKKSQKSSLLGFRASYKEKNKPNIKSVAKILSSQCYC